MKKNVKLEPVVGFPWRAALLLLVVAAPNAVTVVRGAQTGSQASASRIKSSRQKLAPSKCTLWGPATNPAVVTTARVFYLTAVDTDGVPFTESAGADIFEPRVLVEKGGKMHPLKRINWHDLGDGSYMGMFVLPVSTTFYTIEIRMKGTRQLAAGTPLKLGPTTAENCKCQHDAAQSFKAHYQCSQSDPGQQIKSDLQAFSQSGISKEMIDDVMETLERNSSCYVHYVIKDNAIFGEAHGPMQGFKAMMDEILVSLHSKVPLPDTEFVVNLGDWPLLPKRTSGGTELPPLPLFSWCSTPGHFDIVLPTYKMTRAMLQGRDVEKVQELDGLANSVASWDDKKEIAFFRGRPSNEMRVKALLMSKEHPGLLDARVTKNQFNYFPNEEAKREHREFERKYGAKADLLPMKAFFKHKYLLSIDGTVAAYRLASLLAGTSVVFKQDSEYYEHFYAALEPFVHYVPVKRDLSDLLETIEYARTHDDEMRAIARNGREFTRQHIRMPDILCYHLLALEAYAGLLNYTPEVPAGMQPVHVDKMARTCACPKFPPLPRQDPVPSKASAEGATPFAAKDTVRYILSALLGVLSVALTAFYYTKMLTPKRPAHVSGGTKDVGGPGEGKPRAGPSNHSGTTKRRKRKKE